MGTLFIIPTPIGNLGDITLRALETLKQVDGVICEDTRRTSLLLNHYHIQKPLTILNDYNEAKSFLQIIERLKSEENLALVSDAGTPLISDPGYKLVRACLEEGIPVDSLPGPSSITTALTLSGLPPDKFFFLGYLPEKRSHRLGFLKKLTLIHGSIRVTYIAFVAPHKLIKTLENMKEVFGNIDIVICRELTKIHEEIRREKISESLKHFEQVKVKGELTVLLHPKMV